MGIAKGSSEVLKAVGAVPQVTRGADSNPEGKVKFHNIAKLNVVKFKKTSPPKAHPDKKYVIVGGLSNYSTDYVIMEYGSWNILPGVYRLDEFELLEDDEYGK